MPHRPAVTTSARAAILRRHGDPLRIEDIEIDDPRPFEVLVELRSVGVCRTDTHAMAEATPPAVLGHEGAGVVSAVGAAVRRVQPGDKVLTTFATCGTCRRCRQAEVTYCERFNELNFSGQRPDGTAAAWSKGEPIATHFLGQSSFATHCLVDERSVVPLPADADLGQLGPFGCGFMTGAGAVLNALRAEPGSSIAVCGAGAVGLAAIAAAALSRCGTIVAVDTQKDRLVTAGNLGATAVLDPRGEDVGEALRALVPAGLEYAVDTTGVAGVVRGAVAALHTRGTCAVIGAGPSPDVVLDWHTLLNGRTVTGVIGGSSIPDVFLPELVAYYRTGQFPVDELIEHFSFENINEAIAASVSGAVVKPVLDFHSA